MSTAKSLLCVFVVHVASASALVLSDKPNFGDGPSPWMNDTEVMDWLIARYESHPTHEPTKEYKKKFEDLEKQAHNVSWHKQKNAPPVLPGWVKSAVQKARQIRQMKKANTSHVPSSHHSQCGEKIPFKELGLTNSPKMMSFISASTKVQMNRPAWKVTEGLCTIDEDGWLMSPNFREDGCQGGFWGRRDSESEPNWRKDDLGGCYRSDCYAPWRGNDVYAPYSWNPFYTEGTCWYGEREIPDRRWRWYEWYENYYGKGWLDRLIKDVIDPYKERTGGGACTIEITGSAGPIQVDTFETEHGQWRSWEWGDFLVVNGQRYAGRGVESSPQGVIPTGTIRWQPDYWTAGKGFKLSVGLVKQEHEGANSWAQPGVGAKQKLARNGLDKHGTVNGQEPFVKVLKDGFFLVGCFNDAMLEFGDKYGDNKDKYGSVASHANVSIAKYSELVLKDRHVPMTPLVCFQFCRTLPGMVFFGIHNGNECYCEPYYKPQAGDDQGCDVLCEGDDTQMCGNAKGKSSVWEMHLCADTAEDLAANTLAAEEALTYFHETSALTVKLGEEMTQAGDALEDVAGLSGSPDSADFGMAAKKAGGDLTKAFMDGRKQYETLLAAAKIAVDLEGEDFTVATNTAAAENAIKTIQETEPLVFKAASKIYDSVLSTCPASDYQSFGDESIRNSMVKDLRDMMDITRKPDFRLASYAMGEKDLEPQASLCTGKVIGLPMLGLGVSGCGIACEHTLYPEKCVGFNHYQVEGSTDLCFLFSAIKNVEVFLEPASFMQKKRLRKGSSTRAGSAASATCMIKMSQIATGFRPSGELKKNKRCFGDCGGFTARHGLQHYAVPSEVVVNGMEVLEKLD